MNKNFMKVAKKTLDASVVEFERKAFFNASLKLVEAGKFHFVSMDEISFHARVSVMATPFIFESKDDLFSALIENVVSRIEKVMSESMAAPGTFKEKFFGLWTDLHVHYSNQAGIIFLIEQMKGLAQRDIASNVINVLSVFFKTNSNYLKADIQAEVLAAAFHENVLMSARMNDDYDSAEARLKLFPSLLWAAYVHPGN